MFSCTAPTRPVHVQCVSSRLDHHEYQWFTTLIHGSRGAWEAEMAGSTLEEQRVDELKGAPVDDLTEVTAPTADEFTVPPPDAASLRLTVDQLARLVGLAPRTIRAHQARKLLAPPVRQGRTAYYHGGHVRRLEAIKSLQREGFNLYSIESMLGIRVPELGGDAPAAQVRRILGKHLSSVEPHEAEVRRLVEALDQVHPMARDLVTALDRLMPSHASPDDRVALLQSLASVFADAFRAAVEDAAGNS
jgi:DNA-binding transcriptional MerR regulator